MRIADVFERHADSPAIERADGTHVTYRDLLALARRHATSGVVEVPAERSVDFIARCLGAWLGGGAFVPIDPADPRPRPQIASIPDLAYVIGTSGSTGAPKHVLVSHRGLPALFSTQIDAFALGPGARSLWLHSPLFDASISDWGTALLSGATLVLPTADAVSRLTDELASRAITHVDLPPSLLPQLGAPPASLRVVVLGGEPCPVDRVAALARTLRVIVVYGPTEATVCSSLAVVDPARWSRPLIGHPLPSVGYHVLDGELYIAGDPLAFGYANDPAETARRFVVIDGTRMYRTGDRVEPTEHGLAFVGRVDRQCKLRGRRIDLDEVEAAVQRFADSAVVVRDGRLVAFVARPIDRHALRTLLPSWMLPSRFVVGPLPRTATGKIDRGALERCELQPPHIDHAEPFAASLARAWCQVLGVDGVTDDDRFSDLGGDSLARLSFLAATDLEVDGDPTFGQLVERARARRRMEMTVAEAEARGRAAKAGSGTSCTSYPDGNLYNSCLTQLPAVLVTGATGMLGRAVIEALRRRDARPVIALVREPGSGTSCTRYPDNNLYSLCLTQLGDIAKPWLGLDERVWYDLRARVSTVIHCAAAIRLGGDWDDHVDANVRGTAEVIAFAEGKALHHVSTLSVFVSTDRARGRHASTDVPDPEAIVFGGYAQTKVAAEAIARDAGATIYRLGLLVDDTREDDQRARTMRGLAKLGAVPAGCRDWCHDVTPVAHAARAIVDGVLEEARGCRHVTGGERVTVAQIAQRLGLDELPMAVWRERARARIEDADIAMALGAFSERRDIGLFLATGVDL